MEEETQSTAPKSNMTMWLIGLIVLIVAGGGYLLLSNQSKAPSQQPDKPAVQTEATPTQVPTATQEPQMTQAVDKDASKNQSEVKTFTVSGKSFSFDLKEIRVKKGDKVKIVFKNTLGFHDWSVDEFNAQTKQIQEGQTDEVQFVASKSGTFEYYCSVGQHRQNGMVGKLIVE